MELWAHQKDAVEKAKNIRDLALFFEMGTGKTRTALEILRFHYNTSKKISRTLIICPTSVVPNWEAEILKFTKIPSDRICQLRDTVKQRALTYTHLPDNTIFIVNLESFANKEFAEAVQLKPPTILILDESHRCKSSTAKRTKEIIKVSKIMNRYEDSHRYILTGTPVLNTSEDLFTQFLILDGGKTFGENFFQFRYKYFQDKNAFMPKQKHFPNWVPKAGALDALKEKIAPLSVTAKKEDCLDLPPLIRTEIEVQLSNEQKKLYAQMKDDFIAFVDKAIGESQVSVANLAITKALRMQQILSGFLKMEDGTIHTIKDNPRADTLRDLLTDIAPSQKVIVWCCFHEDYKVVREICDSLKLKFAEVTGLVKDKQTELKKFEEDEDVRVMIASQKAGGTGVNMIAASVMIYYSKGYSLEDDMQSEARNYRGGSERHKNITRIDLVARKTVDEIVLSALRGKKDLATSITDLKQLLEATPI
jgi:SNF2 family DNA or RNA helicase